MCASQRPLDGADSEPTCSMCKGSGVMMGGDEYQPCPRCGGHDVVPESATFDEWMAWIGWAR